MLRLEEEFKAGPQGFRMVLHACIPARSLFHDRNLGPSQTSGILSFRWCATGHVPRRGAGIRRSSGLEGSREPEMAIFMAQDAGFQGLRLQKGLGAEAGTVGVATAGAAAMRAGSGSPSGKDLFDQPLGWLVGRLMDENSLRRAWTSSFEDVPGSFRPRFTSCRPKNPLMQAGRTRFDADGDGKISREELASGLSSGLGRPR